MFGPSAARVLARGTALLAMIATAGSIVAGCGGSDSGGTGANSTAAPSGAGQGTPATGSALDVWAIAPVGTPSSNIPQVPAGAKALARYVNGHGGLGKGHHRLVVKDCNTQATPQGEVQCAQQAAADRRAIAAVDPIPLFNAPAFTQTLEKAKLPAINPYINTTEQLTSPINFPLGAPNFTQAACATLVPKAAKVTKVAFADINLPIAVQTAHQGAQAARNAGIDVVGSVTFPVTVTDLAPYIRRLQDLGPQLVVLNMQPPLVGQFISTAARLGNNWTYCGGDGIVFWQQLVGVGSAAANFYVAAQLPEVAEPAGNQVIAQFRRDATAQLEGGDKAASLEPTADPQVTFQAWLSTQVVTQVASKMSEPINRRTFRAALEKATVTFGTGAGRVLPEIDFAKPNPNPKYSRLFNTSTFLKKWNPAKKQMEVVDSVKPEQIDKLVG
jgi:branched-chain amino acid transport system substrate-binding protein